MLLWIDPILDHSSLCRKWLGKLEDTITRGAFYHSICCNIRQFNSQISLILVCVTHVVPGVGNFEVNSIHYCMMIIAGNYSIRRCHISPNMVYSKGWSCVCCCLPASANYSSCCHGSTNSWWSAIPWRVRAKFANHLWNIFSINFTFINEVGWSTEIS